MARKRKFWIFGGVGVGLLAIMAALGSVGGSDAVAVRLAEVGRQDLVASVTASGQLSAKRAVDVSSDITGRIVRLAVEEGDEVQRGDLLLRIDPTQYEAAVRRQEALLSSARAAELQNRANFEQSRRALERIQQLRSTNAALVSDEQLETAETNFEVARANLEAQRHQVEQSEASLAEAEDQLSKTVIRAPMTGKITRLAVEEGEVAIASTFNRETGLLLTISDLSVIQVNVDVDETDVVRLELGDSAEVTIDAFRDTTFVGSVTSVSQSAIRNAQSGSSDQAVDFDVEITLTNPPPGVRPDLSATAKIVTDTRDSALAIPIIALTVREHRPISTEVRPTSDTTAREREGVFVVEGGIARFRPVRVGIAGEEYFEVISGLSEGDSIVAGPYQTIRDLSDSTAVRPRETAGEGAGQP